MHDGRSPAGAPNAALRISLAEQLVRLRGDAPDALLDAVLERVELPGGPLVRVRPRSFDAVREAEALAGPGRPTPYWASAWPAGTALARAVAAAPGLAGRNVVELGCGLGLPSVAAARAGARVLATDRSPEAVVYAAHNLALNEVEAVVAVADWRELAASPDRPQDGWDLLLAADVLYTSEAQESLVRLLPRAVAPGGEVWVADPGRAGCRDFLAAVRARWRIATTPDRVSRDIRVHRLTRRPPRRRPPKGV